MPRKLLPKLSTNRTLAASWHPKKNGGLKPADVSLGAHRKAWWRCPKDSAHEWEAVIANRARLGTGCPFCSHARVTRATSLGAMAPAVARSWHREKNGSVTPFDVTCFSQRSAWWRCSKGHEFTAQVRDRARGRGCPQCAGRYPGSLARHFPRIAREWHPNKNGELTPRDVKPGSNLVASWRCPAGHVYQRKVAERTRAHRGCPRCEQTERESQRSLAILHPDIAREWHPTKNGRWTPRDVAAGSHDRITWRCSADPTHVWETSVVKRTRRGQGCPMCARKVATPKTCLRARNPVLAAEWHPSLNGELTPDNVMPGSNRRVTWQCLLDSSHVWQQLISTRARRGAGCPYCAGQRVTEGNCLATRRPDIAAEWHTELNHPLRPADVAWRTDRKAWWKCSASRWHVFEASIAQRTRGASTSGCPYCRGLRVPKHKSLTTTHPEIARAWDVAANAPLMADAIAPTSSRLVWWRCPLDATRWRARVQDVTSGRVGCMTCSAHELNAPSAEAIRGTLSLGPVALDAARRQVVFPNGASARLAMKELYLLSALARSTGKTVPYERLVEAVWPIGERPTDKHRLNTVADRLRARLGSFAWMVRSEPKAGYRLVRDGFTTGAARIRADRAAPRADDRPRRDRPSRHQGSHAS